MNVENSGTRAATDVSWTIELDGNLVLSGEKTSDTFETVEADGQQQAKTGLVFGLGKITIEVTVADLEKSRDGFLLGPFVFIL